MKEDELHGAETPIIEPAEPKVGSPLNPDANNPTDSDGWLRKDDTKSKKSIKLTQKRKVIIIVAVILCGVLAIVGFAVANKNSSDIALENQLTDKVSQSETNAQNNETQNQSTADDKLTNSGDGSSATSTTEDSGSTQPPNTGQSVGSSTPSKTGTTYTITYTFSGCYSPSNIPIDKGDTVIFVNNDSKKPMWPASDNHPTHTIYSEFDVGTEIEPGKSWSFTFSKAGTWGYHDHVKSSCRGTITVK